MSTEKKKIRLGQIGIGHNHGEAKMLNYRKFPEIFAECMNDNEDDRFEYAYVDMESSEPSYDDGRIDGALTLCKLFELSPTEAAAHVTAAMECDPCHALDRAVKIYNNKEVV